MVEVELSALLKLVFVSGVLLGYLLGHTIHGLTTTLADIRRKKSAKKFISELVTKIIPMPDAG